MPQQSRHLRIRIARRCSDNLGLGEWCTAHEALGIEPRIGQILRLHVRVYRGGDEDVDARDYIRPRG